MMRKVCLVLLVLLPLISTPKPIQSSTISQGQLPVGRFLSPGKGQVIVPAVPVPIHWELDTIQEIQSQDLILSTDGGFTFDLWIAANMPSAKRQLSWTIRPHKAVAKAKLKVALHTKSGQDIEIISDDFSLTPSTANQSQSTATVAEKASTGSANFEAALFDPCVSGTTPSLDYINTDTAPCRNVSNEIIQYGAEPALAQDPTDPTHFVMSEANGFGINCTGLNYGWDGNYATRNLPPDVGFRTKSDTSVAIAKDGTVYVAKLATTSVSTQ